MIRSLVRIVCGLCAFAISVVIVVLILSNRSETIIALHPLPYEITLPIYMVIAIAFLLGLCIGLILYMRLKFRTSLERRKLRRQLAAAKPSQ
jgi:uncharacterized membrane protein YciS (DUF1049 family)